MLIDAFQYFNEADLLEIRFEELYPVVDRFILVESTHTHKGDPKPLYYGENRQRYARFNDKMIHVVVADLPHGDGLPAIRRREMTQRQRILDGLRDAPDDAVVLISDVDEIPRRTAVQRLVGGIPDGMVVVFLQKLFYYNVNTSAPDRPWPGTRAARAADVRALTPHAIRNGLAQPDTHYPIHARIDDAGWHLSYLGDVEHIQRKMGAFLHQELVNADTTDPDVIARHIAAGEDVWGRTNEQRFIIGPASDLPTAVRCNPVKWLHLFHPDWCPTFHENWYDPYQADAVAQLAAQAPEGAIVEIGSWEGRSAVAIAQAIAPRTLHCVDHWRGNEDEGDKESIGAAQERDVLADFVCNMERLTSGNWEHRVQDWRDWTKVWGADYKQDPVWYDHPGIAFLHLDASHDYQSVASCLRAILPLLVPGAILCGDDYYGEGVHRAVHDVLGDVHDIGGRLWVWQKEGNA